MHKITLLAGILALFFACSPTAEKVSNDVPEKYYDSVIAVAGRTFAQGQTAACFQYLDSTYATIKEPSEAGLIKKYLLGAYLNGQFLHNFENSNAYADSALQLLTKSTDKELFAQYAATVYYTKGDASFDVGNYKETYSSYYKAKAQAIKTADTCALSDYNYRLGMVMYKQQHYKEAAHFFSASFEQNFKCGGDFAFFYRKQELLNNLALSYFMYGANDSALFFYNKGLAFIDQSGPAFAAQKASFNETAKAVIYGNMAKIYAARKDYRTAEKLLKESISINTKEGHDIKDAQTALITLADVYRSQNQYEKLYATLDQLNTSFQLAQTPGVRLRWNELMWEYHKNQNLPEKGYKFLRDYVALKDSLAEAKYLLNEVNVNSQLTNLAYQSTIDQLKRNDTVRKMALAATFIFALLVSAILFLIVYNSRRSKRNVKLLTMLNADILDKQERLQHALADLETQLREKDRILRIVAHDLRSPIGGIAGLSALVLEAAPENNAELKIIHEVANDSLQLINEILEVAGLAETPVSKKQLVDVNEVLFNCVTLAQFKAREKNQQIQTELQEHVEPLELNKEKIARVINNLISNAIKFSPPQSLIKVMSRPVSDGVIISIEDNGIGMPEGAGEEVFDMFTTAKRPGTAGEKSFGLGLSICRQVIADHGGKIWFESRKGQGTTFYIKLYYTRSGSTVTAKNKTAAVGA